MKATWFKRILAGAISAALCCGLLSGCGEQQLAAEMPEEGTLTVSYLTRRDDIDGIMLQLAEKEFEETYTGWNVEIDSIVRSEADYEDRVQKLLNNMMVGKGPDVLLINRWLCDEVDMNKVSRSGTLIDLAPYFEEWNWDGYNTTVIDSLKMDGKQYIMPLSYYLPLYITGEDELKETGIDLDACKTGKGLLEQFNAYNERAKEDPSMPMLFGGIRDTLYQQLFDVMQMNPLDYDAGKVNWDENTRELLELYKELYPVDIGEEIINVHSIKEGMGIHDCIMEGDYLFCQRDDDWGEQVCSLFLLEDFVKPMILPVYNYDGSGISVELCEAAGVLDSSQNKAAAVEFVKTLLGADAQSHSMIKKQQAAGGGYRDYYFANGGIPVYEKGITDMWNMTLNMVLSPWQLVIVRSSIMPSYTAVEEYKTFEHTPDEILSQVIELTHQVTNCYIRNCSGAGNVTEYFEDYLKGEVSYEKAFDKADNTLNIYASE